MDAAAGDRDRGVRVALEGVAAEAAEAVGAVAATRRVEAVVARGHVDLAAGDLDDLRLQPLVALKHGDAAAAHFDAVARMDAVVAA